jgi:UDP:flavonoid glycosyltransferase YjiC (YdhE family)
VHLAPNVFRSTEDAIHLPGRTLSPRVPAWVRNGFWWFIDRAVIDRLIAPELNRFRAEHGLKPIKRVFRDWIHSPDSVIGLWPDWFAPQRRDWPAQTRLAGFPLYDAAAHEALPAGLEAFLAAGDLPVLFAPGSANTDASEFFTTSLEACERVGRRAIFVSRYGRQIECELPDRARHFEYLPFSTVLPRCSAFVSHGGIGSVSQGFRAGVPHIVRAMGFDQFENGRRAEQIGVARMLPAKHSTAESVAEALDGLASAACVSACRSVAGRFSGRDALDEAADAVESAGAA